MSMRSSFIYGYGFECACEDTKLINFIKNHKESFCQSEKEQVLYDTMPEKTEEEYELEDFFSGYACDVNTQEGIGAVIANIIARETDIRFLYAPPDGDCDTEAAVVFEMCYPWNLNETEKNLTEEKLYEICKKYMDELEIEDIPDYLSLEYYG